MGQRAAYEDTDFVPCDRADWDTTVLERLVSAFEEQAMAASMDLASLAVMWKKGASKAAMLSWRKCTPLMWNWVAFGSVCGGFGIEGDNLTAPLRSGSGW